MPLTSRQLLRFAMLGAIAATLALGACGRKGPLDPPPGSSVMPSATEEPSTAPSGSAAQPTNQTIYGVDGRPLAPRGQKKRLPADVLID